MSTDLRNGENGDGRDGRGRFASGARPGPGRPPGCENRATADAKAVKAEILASWPRFGPAAIERVATERPHDYLRLVAALLPRDEPDANDRPAINVKDLVLEAKSQNVTLEQIFATPTWREHWPAAPARHLEGQTTP